MAYTYTNSTSIYVYCVMCITIELFLPKIYFLHINSNTNDAYIRHSAAYNKTRFSRQRYVERFCVTFFRSSVNFIRSKCPFANYITLERNKTTPVGVQLSGTKFFISTLLYSVLHIEQQLIFK